MIVKPDSFRFNSARSTIRYICWDWENNRWKEVSLVIQNPSAFCRKKKEIETILRYTFENPTCEHVGDELLVSKDGTLWMRFPMEERKVFKTEDDETYVSLLAKNGTPCVLIFSGNSIPEVVHARM